ncbi:3' terminal RNA ribose 2'-O-methyltransferase Hen1 [Goodfellowiella coeruleoviolacea]|uniref:Small RNA 2'-O-methyltransferase n=1 Tax=Goodfellowiella coeruleoviolacea TaxID=334858 RepID=A0AAE3GAR9_9PSEU|nr:3' terminal RNA ribose 2'-O-methyltransferase Hen1 [Goodfellowiella coeruleoviolacea]MCP2163995.1 3' terminal RNA ribose 2'-O-methyltransferase Hen1 [Goodfellowiella coeruleoviolacea]
MFLTLTTDQPPATDLGFLLHKHPQRAQSFTLASGTAHVFYPRADADECTAALLLEVDPVGLVRGRRDSAFALGQYVNDRPYAAGSLLAVALGAVFRTALKGRCDARPDLAARPIPLRVRIPALPCHGGPDLVARLFGPLGWRVAATPVPLDPVFPEWGAAPYLDVRLSGRALLSDALKQLYVLLPVLDNAKHYWVAEDEVAKLLRAGEGWLAGHPERELITARYLVHRRPYVASALARLAEADEVAADELDNSLADAVATDQAQPGALALARRQRVLAVLREAGARRVLDLGCGSGALLADLLAEPAVTEIVGVDVAARALAAAERRLRLDRMSERQRARISLRQSALTYLDPALAGYDAAVLMEVVEHVDPGRLPALERAVFHGARPGTVVVTTPNAEYNVRFPALGPNRLRHPDHRFEWTREQFRAWAGAVAERRGYRVRHLPVGQPDPEVGAPTQLAVFTRKDG